MLDNFLGHYFFSHSYVVHLFSVGNSLYKNFLK